MKEWLPKTSGTLFTMLAAMLIIAHGQQNATAGQYGYGSAPKVTGRRTTHNRRVDPVPQMTQQRRTIQTSRNPVPRYARRPETRRNVQRPSVHRRPRTAPRVDPRVEQARYRSNYYRNREAEVFYDDDPAYSEELPTPDNSGDIIYDEPYMEEGGGGYGGETWHEGAAWQEGEIWQEGPDFGGGCESCGQGAGYCGYGHPFCRAFNWLVGSECGWCWSENLTAFAGVDAFTSPVDFENEGNFGFDYGVDWAGPLWNSFGLGYQVGGRVVQSNLSGYDQTSNFGLFDDDSRNQYFLTAGLFRRFRHATGMQWGVVYDYLSDNYYVDATLSQIRAEISIRGPKRIEIGVWTATNVGDDSFVLPNLNGQAATSFVTWETTDQYNLFLRHTTCDGNEMRIWGGVTGDSDGIVGADFRMPFNDQFAIAGVFNYLIPSEGSGPIATQQEAWGLGINLVWYPGRTAKRASNSPWRPLFNVANNATMIPNLSNSTVGN